MKYKLQFYVILFLLVGLYELHDYKKREWNAWLKQKNNDFCWITKLLKNESNETAFKRPHIVYLMEFWRNMTQRYDVVMVISMAQSKAAVDDRAQLLLFFTSWIKESIRIPFDRQLNYRDCDPPFKISINCILHCLVIAFIRIIAFQRKERCAINSTTN